MNPIILPPAMGKIVRQTRFFSLGEATSLREGKLCNKTKQQTNQPLLPLFSGLLWPGVVVIARISSPVQIDLFVDHLY